MFANPNVAPYNARARVCSGPGNRMRIDARTCGARTVAIRAGKIRPRINAVGEAANPHRRDATENPATPIRNIRLRPSRSPRRPPVNEHDGISRGVCGDDKLHLRRGSPEALADGWQGEIDNGEI